MTGQPRDLADTPTPPPMPGTWTLTAPDGRQWQAESPLKCCKAEMDERVPAAVALARIMREARNADDPAVLVADLGKLRHMLGIDAYRPRKGWCYRNHFNAGGKDIESMHRLVSLSLAREYMPGYWCATEAGCQALGLTYKETQRALHP